MLTAAVVSIYRLNMYKFCKLTFQNRMQSGYCPWPRQTPRCRHMFRSWLVLRGSRLKCSGLRHRGSWHRCDTSTPSGVCKIRWWTRYRNLCTCIVRQPTSGNLALITPYAVGPCLRALSQIRQPVGASSEFSINLALYFSKNPSIFTCIWEWGLHLPKLLAFSIILAPKAKLKLEICQFSQFYTIFFI